jgi:FAD-dependent urate hydroxylase
MQKIIDAFSILLKQVLLVEIKKIKLRGCQAMEDGLLRTGLTSYLSTTNLGVFYALKRYEAERTVRANTIVDKARSRAEQIHGKDPVVTQQRYEQLTVEKPRDVTDAITKVIMAEPLR